MLRPDLLVTKFTLPPVRQTLLSRSHLLTALDSRCLTPLTLLSAPTGFGKTTLLSTWARHHAQNTAIAWLTLDEQDNDPTRFWSYVVAALRQADACRGEATLAMLHSPQPAQLSVALTALLNELATREAETTLIVDDYHVIREPSIHESLLFVLEHLPSTLHLILASRVDPPLPLARLRAKGQLCEIRELELRLSAEETAEFLSEVMHLALTEDTLEQLTMRTEGWIAGVQLAALALSRQEDRTAFLQTFTGSHRYLLDYVQQEILQPLPLPWQQFLLQIAVLPRMNAALCQAVTGVPESQEMLELLERQNLFLVPLDGQRQWYRLHDLFREVLLARLQATQPELVSELHRRAATFHEERDELREAVAHALAAEDFSYAARLMERSIEQIWLRGELQTLYRWIMALPDEEICQHSRMVLDAALYLLHATATNMEEQRVKGRVQVNEMIARVEQSRRQPEEPIMLESEEARLLLRLQLLRLYLETYEVLFTTDDPEPYRRITQQIQQLDQDEETLWQMIPLHTTFLLSYNSSHQAGLLVPPLQSALQRARASGNSFATLKISQWLVIACFEAGRLHLTYEQCLAALSRAEQIEAHPIFAGYICATLADVLYEWNRLEEVDVLSQKLIQAATNWQHLDLHQYGWYLACKSALAGGNLTRAEQALHTLEDPLWGLQPWASVPWTVEQRVRYWLATGNLSAASKWVDQVISSSDGFQLHSSRAMVGLVRVYCARGEYSRAVELCEQFSASLDRPGECSDAIIFLALFFLSLHHAGRTEQARRVAARLFARTSPEGYLRLYLDEGELMRQALLALLPREGMQQEHPPLAPGLASSASKLLAAFDNEEQKMGKSEIASPFPSAQLLPSPISSASSQGDQPLLEPLTRREEEVLLLLAQGATNQEIANRLVLSLTTVKKHVGSLLLKLAAENRTHAVARARELSLL